MINLEDIVAGDTVTISDVTGNRCQGVVMVSLKDRSLAVYAFGSAITFARPTRMGHCTVAHGLRVLDHQPQLFPAA